MKYFKAILFLSLFALIAIPIMTHEPAPDPTNTEQCVDPEYSMSGGVMYTAVTLIKRQLNDPDSYQTIEQHFAGTRIVTNYRAKNGFGGYVTAVSISEVTYVGGKCMVTLIQ